MPFQLRTVLVAFLAALFTLMAPSAALAGALEEIKARGVLLYGADVEGGMPYVAQDAKNPEIVTGFEAEIMEALAKELGVKAQLVHNAWDGLIPAMNRGNFDIVINGLEITPERREVVLYSRPYYVYTQQIVVRQGTKGLETLNDLAGKRVGTLSGTVAERLLTSLPGIDLKLYPSNVQPYDDLLLGRLDAVLMDTPIAAYYGKREGLVTAGRPFSEGFYAIGIRKQDKELKLAIDEAIGTLLANGELERILKGYDLWNEAQAPLFSYRPEAETTMGNASFWGQLRDSWPLFLRGAAMTVTVSVLAMVLAIALGILLAVTRVYGPKPLGALAATYVEIFRGTPLLIQLFLIYYGLPTLGIQLDAFVAAVVGLGLNYAAYEAENYRAGLLAVPKGQMEAAMALGMNRWQALQHIQLPQSLRIVIPPVTNDFIALFKDSSVVSIITMVELTKVYGMLASSTYNYIGFGLVTAAIYFVISYPTSLFARWLEVRLRVA